MYLIINLGLKSIRAIVIDENANQIYSMSRPVRTYIYKDFVEQDANEWQELLYELLDELRLYTNVISKVQYVTVTTSSSCILGLGEQNKPLTKVMMVSDKRAIPQLTYIRDLVEYKEINQPCSVSYALPKVLWHKDNSTNYSEISCWVNAGDYIVMLLTGKIFTDPFNASKFLYDDVKGYPQKLYDALSIPVSVLPKVEKIGYITELSYFAREKFGFSDNCLFVQSTYDAICAVIGSGNGQSGNACDVSGTVTSVRMLVDERIVNDSRLLIHQKIDILNKYIVGASNNLGGGLIEWLKQAFYDEDDVDVYYKMEYDAIKASLGASGIIFLPYLLGERAPFVSSTIRGEFIGIPRSAKRLDFTRAVFEASAYVTKDLLSMLNLYQPRTLSVSGGLARFDIINQIKADVTNLPVYVVENFESTSVGALLICLLSLDKTVSYNELCDKFVKIRKIINPNENNSSIYGNLYNFFVSYREQILSHYELHANICRHLDGYKITKIQNL
ncbi:MAG: FGGY-family carbohydrate kinase [Mediterranea sp.]|jgi:xylulokinase|nr:FGGY-family carbohydrate kinase [Mediterranea sp.]